MSKASSPSVEAENSMLSCLRSVFTSSGLLWLSCLSALFVSIINIFYCLYSKKNYANIVTKSLVSPRFKICAFGCPLFNFFCPPGNKHLVITQTGDVVGLCRISIPTMFCPVAIGHFAIAGRVT